MIPSPPSTTATGRQRARQNCAVLGYCAAVEIATRGARVVADCGQGWRAAADTAEPAMVSGGVTADRMETNQSVITMPTLPFWLRWASHQWQSIKAKVDSQALNLGLPTYAESPKLYRFDGWGLVGLRLACNVKYLNNEYVHDFGRVVA